MVEGPKHKGPSLAREFDRVHLEVMVTSSYLRLPDLSTTDCTTVGHPVIHFNLGPLGKPSFPPFKPLGPPMTHLHPACTKSLIH